MAQQTLLTMVQNILAALDSDEVNSINDTTESQQVANIIQNKYYDIVSRGSLPEDEDLFQLTPGGTTLPTVMTLPAGTASIEWIKYFDSNPNDSLQVDQFGSFAHDLNVDIVSTSNWQTTSTTSATVPGTFPTQVTWTVVSSNLPITVGQGVLANATNTAISMFGTVVSYLGTTLVLNVTSAIGTGTFASWSFTNNPSQAVPGYKYVTKLTFEEFLNMVNRFNPSDSNVFSYTFSNLGYNFTLSYKNNIQPRFCTVFSNQFVFFDSYNINFDSFLQQSKTMAYGQIIPTFFLLDTFVPPIDDNQFPLLLNEAKSLAFYELKQMPHQKADQ